MNWKLDIKGIVEPFSALKYLFKRPATLTYPDVKREIADDYRGFHVNEQARCIGCGLCEDICMNEAIDMVTPQELRNPKNTSGLIPRVDYGRCCWCSLCTDVCPVKSLKLTSEFVLVTENPSDYIYDIPDPKWEEKNEK
jgi:formate hydrogenlyase subunit 6/NADH:ubiquinone oxidoreductase subunit I